MAAKAVSTTVQWWLLLLGLAILGCGTSLEPPLPPLHPVTGLVLKGNRPVQGGSLRLAPVNSQEPIIILGEVNQEGRFELTTIKGKEKGPGVPEGTYEVTYIPPLSGQEVVPETLPKPQIIKPGGNKLTINLP